MVYKYYSITEVCEAVGIGRTKFYQLINSGQLKAKKIGVRTLILSHDLDAFLDTLEAYNAKGGHHEEKV